MASKKSFFNRAIYWKNLKRFYPWAAVYGLILFIPTGLLQVLIHVSQEPDCATMQEAVFSSGTLVMLMLPLAALLAGSLLYQYLYQDAATQLLHSLPISRRAHGISTFLSGLTLLELPLLLVQVFCAVYALALGYTVMLPMLLKLYAAYALATLFYFGLVSFCVQLAGSGKALVVLFGLLNSLAAWASLLRYALYSLFYPTIYPELFGDLAARLTPLYYLLACTMDSSWYIETAGTDVTWEFLYAVDLVPYLWYAFAGLLLMALGLLLYQRRQLERAGDALAFPVVKAPVQVLFATLTGLDLSLLFRAEIDLSVLATLVIFILGGALGYFVLGMLIDKTVHVFKAGLRGYAIFVLLTLAISGGAQLDVLGVRAQVPAADEVVSISFSYYRPENLTDSDLIAEAIALHQQLLEEYDRLSQPRDGAITETIVLRYTLEDGSTLARRYPIYITSEDFDDEGSVASHYYALVNDAVVITSSLFGQGVAEFYSFVLDIWVYEYSINTWDVHIEVYEEDAALVCQAFLQDIEEGNLLYNGCSVTGSSSSYLFENHSYYNGWIEILYYTEDGSLSHFSDIQLDAGMVHTIAALEELGLLTPEYKAYLGM